MSTPNPSLFDRSIQPRANIPSEFVPAENMAILYAVADIAALAALDDSTFVDGVVVAMASVLDQWQLDRNSTLTPDGITIVAANSGTGNWLRLRIPSLRWQKQDTWHINALTGDDENDGLTGPTALASHAELERRVGAGPIFQFTTVFIDSNLSEDIIVRARPNTAETAGWIYQGARTVVFSGTVTATTAYDPTTDTPGSITAAAIPVSWTASGLLNRLIVLTGGANAGATAWVAKDLGAKAARHSPFYFGAIIDPAVTDTFDVVTLTTITGQLIIDLPNSVNSFVDLAFAPVAKPAFIGPGGSTVGLITCDMVGDGFFVIGSTFVDAISTQLRATDSISVEEAGVLYLDACLLTGAVHPLVSAGGEIVLSLGSLAQSAGGAVGLLVGKSGSVRMLSGGWLGIFDDASSAAGLLVWVGGSVSLADYLWGTGNTFAFGIRVDSGATVAYDSTKTPRLQTPATAETQIGGTNTTYAGLPFANAARQSGIVFGQFF